MYKYLTLSDFVQLIVQNLGFFGVLVQLDTYTLGRGRETW